MRYYPEFAVRPSGLPFLSSTGCCPICKSHSCHNSPSARERERSQVLQISRGKLAAAYTAGKAVGGGDRPVGRGSNSFRGSGNSSSSVGKRVGGGDNSFRGGDNSFRGSDNLSGGSGNSIGGADNLLGRGDKLLVRGDSSFRGSNNSNRSFGVGDKSFGRNDISLDKRDNSFGRGGDNSLVRNDRSFVFGGNSLATTKENRTPRGGDDNMSPVGRVAARSDDSSDLRRVVGVRNTLRRLEEDISNEIMKAFTAPAKMA